MADDDNEHERRIEELKQRAEELSGGDFISEEAANCPPEVREQFWEQVVAFEEAETITHFDELSEAGLELPPPDELDDARLSEKLWALIHALADGRTYLHSTDHLSDRELYAHLWSESLREETVRLSDIPGYTQHIDIIGSGSEEDIEIYLRYYADEEYRRDWAARWPDDLLPPREQPPYDRDRTLPDYDPARDFEAEDRPAS
ncbi:MAG: hypothetical protein ACRD9R_11465 [Pyrinomonadaceae bacterium]